MFVGLILLMGVKRLREIRDHWSTDEMVFDHYISWRMSRNRFEDILSKLHSNASGVSSGNTDRLRKIRPMIEILNESFRSRYHPTSEVSMAI